MCPEVRRKWEKGVEKSRKSDSVGERQRNDEKKIKKLNQEV